MKNENKVLACVDQSRFADVVADYAAWAARRMDAPLELLHIIDRHPERGSGEDHSGAIGIGAEENLMGKLTAADEARTQHARNQGRIFLNRLRERASASGAEQVDVRQRLGELEETLSEQEVGVRMLVLGRHGQAAEANQKGLGRNVERVIRALNKPILAVSEHFKEPQRVMIAFDGSNVTRRGVEMVADSPLFRSLPIYLLMSATQSKEAARQLAWAQSTLETAGFEVTAALIQGEPGNTIAKTIKEQAIDVLVMGAFSHSPLRALLFGSKTADLLRYSCIPTLLLR